jgi:hypothetical protein
LIAPDEWSKGYVRVKMMRESGIVKVNNDEKKNDKSNEYDVELSNLLNWVKPESKEIIEEKNE